MQGALELTPDEATLLRRIDFGVAADHQRFQESAAAACALTTSLLERKAIPRARIAYFIDPEFNIGGRGASRRDIFERNGVRGDNIFRHGNFVKYLWYFIHGAALPASAINAIVEAVENAGSVTSGDIEPLQVLARQLVRTHGLDPKIAAEEFFKLGLDCELSPSEARFIRDAVLRVK